LVVARRIGYQRQIRMFLQIQALLARDQGEFHQAEQLLREALQPTLAMRDPRGQSLALIYLGQVLVVLQREQEAEASLREGIDLAEQMGEFERHCYGMLALVDTILLPQRRFSEATRLLHEAASLAQQAGQQHFLCQVAMLTGEFHRAQKQWEAAHQAFQEACQLATNRDTQAASLFGLAQVFAAQQQVSEAVRLGEESQRLFAAMGNHRAQEISMWLGALREH
jgi:tetratricopeptide (TPR) repeat protein